MGKKEIECIHYYGDIMLLINEIVTPLNENKEIDLVFFNQLLDISISKGNDYQLIFSALGDGHFLSLEEKKALVNSISQNNISQVIYFFQLTTLAEDEKVINFLKNSNIEIIMISPPSGFFYHQNGLFIYMKNILKKLKNKKIILYNNPSQYQISFHFQTIKKLIKLYPNIIGIYENSKDVSLIGLLKQNFSSLHIYVNEKMIEHALKASLDGIISGCSLIYGEDYIQIFNDYQHQFLNRIMIDYLLFVNEILSFSNSSTLFKAYLKKLGYPSMFVRLPLVIEQSDIENLDFLLS